MELLAVHAEYSVCGTPSSLDMVAKVLPHDPMTRAFIRECALDKREIKFYTEVRKFSNLILVPFAYFQCPHFSSV